MIVKKSFNFKITLSGFHSVTKTTCSRVFEKVNKHNSTTSVENSQNISKRNAFLKLYLKNKNDTIKLKSIYGEVCGRIIERNRKYQNFKFSATSMQYRQFVIQFNIRPQTYPNLGKRKIVCFYVQCKTYWRVFFIIFFQIFDLWKKKDRKDLYSVRNN